VAAVDGNEEEEDVDAPDCVVTANDGASVAMVGEDFTTDETERRRRGGTADRVDIRHCWWRAEDRTQPYFSTMSCLSAPVN